MSRVERLRAMHPGEARRQLEAAVEGAERRASWKGSGYGPIAEMYRRLIQTHQPASTDEAPACASCGDRWLCPSVANVLVGD